MANLLPTALALFGATLIAYLPAFGAEFIWDDDAYLTTNAVLFAPDALRRIWFELGATIQYYPLVFTSFWIEHHLWGLNPAGYHVVNILLHAVAAVLLWRVLVRLEVPGAAWAAAIFVLHPVHVESVAWVTERKNVLSIIFYLLAIRAYAPFLRADSASPQSNSQWQYVTSLLWFVAALLSKTSTVTLPVALLLFHWWKSARIRLSDVVRGAPFVAASLAAGLVTSYVEKHHVGAAEAEWTLSLVERVLVAGRAVCFYLGKLLAPVDLAFIYHRWTVNASDAVQWLFPAMVAIAVGATLIVHRRIGRGPVVALLYFVVTLGPILGFVKFFFMGYSFVADHFQYLASPGPIALIAAIASKPMQKAAVRAAAIAVLLVLGALTFQRARVFKNSEALWNDVLAKSPSAARMAHENLAQHFTNLGRAPDAIPHFDAALAIKPDAIDTRMSYAVVLHAVGRIDDAIANLKQVLARDPVNYIAAVNTGLFLAEKGDLNSALMYYQRGIATKPDFATAHFNLARLYARLGRRDDAIKHYREAVRLDPADAEAARELMQLTTPSTPR
ncbi:MAG: tetratricopeptide repeat protein [Planctomycetes bacterium]|nr:tetratricopeptide repeat protein [Planctomycetota bacterium]